MTKQELLDKIKGGLIVSCQALEHEPLYSSYIMGRMAYAAMLGGAVGIRCNTVVDIHEIKQNVDLPIIGIIKKTFDNSEVYITPTMEEVDALMAEGVDIMAIDATDRIRPDGSTLTEFFARVKEKYPNQLFMADCSTYEEGMYAEKLGFDFIGTTLYGYTAETRGLPTPNFEMMRRLAEDLHTPLIAEGGISSPEQLKMAMDQGAHACVVGGAITRPMDITKRYVKAITE